MGLQTHPIKCTPLNSIKSRYKIVQSNLFEQRVCHMLLFVMQCVDGACRNLQIVTLNRPFK